jgi:hypothetical protein
LQADSTPAGEWAALRAQLLGGAEPEAALAACFPGRFRDAEERELWWQTGWHHVRRARSQPMLGIGESREALAGLGRFVFSVGGADGVVPLRFVVRRTAQPAVRAALTEKGSELQRLVPVLHPFYRNAGLALAACLAPAKRESVAWDALVDDFDREWLDATNLERTSREALDALVARRR